MRRDYLLSGRHKEVLKIVVTAHIQSAAPTGSAYVSEILDLSSATIRNVMCELEEMGYISKPHTSAGRIPTTNGYRYYVNNLLELDSVSKQQKRFVENEYYRKVIDTVDTMLERISHILSVMTKYAGIACTSNLRFYVEGTSNMIDMPEFRNPERVRILLRLFDEREELLRVLNEDSATDGVKIHIGNDDRDSVLGELSFVTSNYRIRGSGRGSMGVLGPMRMNYSTLIPLVDFVSKTIEAILDDSEIWNE